MPTFFQSWRRKLSVVTLVLACVFMAWWVRSIGTSDFSIWKGERAAWGINSGCGLVECIQFNRVADGVPPTSFEMIKTGWDSLESIRHDGFRVFVDAYEDDIANCEKKFEYHGLIFATGKFDRPIGHVTTCYLIFPFSYLIVPLTLLSAWLLLSKPRAKPTGSS